MLLFPAVAAHSLLMDRWFARQPPGSYVGFAVLFAPILLVLVGEWIATDAGTQHWGRRGFAVVALGALWHLMLDGACLGAVRGSQALWSVLSVLLGGAIMALIFRGALRGMADPAAALAGPKIGPDIGPATHAGGWVDRCAREASLFGGTAIALVLVSMAFVAMAAVGLWRHPREVAGILAAGGFFLLCGAVGVWMGLDRRALLLGRPSPAAGLWPRFLRRSVVVATQQGLAQVTRRGATVYAWESIRAVELGEFYGNAAVLIGLSDEPVVSRFDRTGQALPADPRWAAREAWNRDVQRQLSGFDLAVMGVLTESGPGVLARQVVDLLTNYDARAALPTVAQAVSDLAGGSGRGR